MSRLKEIVDILKQHTREELDSMSNKEFLELLNPGIDFTFKPFTKEDEEFFESLNA